MRERKLRINKNDVYVFNLVKYHDKINGNTYQMFTGGFRISKGQRFYFSDNKIKGWNPRKSFQSYADPYDMVKEWLRNNTNVKFEWMNELQNVIAIGHAISYQEYSRLSK